MKNLDPELKIALMSRFDEFTRKYLPGVINQTYTDAPTDLFRRAANRMLFIQRISEEIVTKPDAGQTPEQILASAHLLP